MRTDRVSCYGHHRDTTPHLDEIASQATRYNNAYSPAPWTLPTHTSLFTGLFPSEHGITNAFPNSNLGLSKEIPTLAEKLRNNGYITAGFSNNPWVGKSSGLDRGFMDYVEWNLEIRNERISSIHTQTDRIASRFNSIVGHAARQPLYILKRPFFTDSLIRRASSWIRSATTDDKPWFCFMNLMEAHSPYFPRKKVFRQLGLDIPGSIEPRILNTKLLAYIMGKKKLDEKTQERIMEFYDASLRYQDNKMKSLLDAIRKKGVFDNTLIIICSDHGKTLGEFNRTENPPHYLRDINIRVPLIIKEPNQNGGKIIDLPVELVSTHEYMIDGGSKSLTNYQPNMNCALFEDYIPHSGRQIPKDGTDYWRGIVTGNEKFIENDSKKRYFFEGRGITEQIVSKPDFYIAGYSKKLSSRADKLNDSTNIGGNHPMDELAGDVQAQLEDLGYME